MGYFIWDMPNNKALRNAEQILAAYLEFIVNSEDEFIKIWHIKYQTFYIVPKQL